MIRFVVVTESFFGFSGPDSSVCLEVEGLESITTFTLWEVAVSFGFLGGVWIWLVSDRLRVLDICSLGGFLIAEILCWEGMFLFGTVCSGVFLPDIR